MADLAQSARGWHGVQLAVLAFIGLCGVLSDVDAGTPRWLQIAAGVLAITALVLSCLSIFVVASVAWPFPTGRADGATAESGRGDPVAAARRLKIGVALTYSAVGVMALAASSSWWPTPTSDGADEIDAVGAAGTTVEITDGAGNTACGELVEGPTGRIRIVTAAGPVELATSSLARVVPTETC